MAHAPNEPHPPCADLSAVEARYLLAILDLERAAGAPTQAEVARSVGVCAPTALEMIRRLRALGFVAPGTVASRTPARRGPGPQLTPRGGAHARPRPLGVYDERSRAEAGAPRGRRLPRAGRRLHPGAGARPGRPRASGEEPLAHVAAGPDAGRDRAHAPTRRA